MDQQAQKQVEGDVPDAEGDQESCCPLLEIAGDCQANGCQHN